MKKQTASKYCVVIAEPRRHEKLSFLLYFLRKAWSSCSGNEGWWYSTICCSSTTPSGNLIQTQNAILVRRGFALYMWINTFKALRDAILLISSNPKLLRVQFTLVIWHHMSEQHEMKRKASSTNHYILK